MSKQVTFFLQISKLMKNAFGQRVNLNKCELSWSRNVPSNKFNELSQLMGVKVVKSHDKYLGLPTWIGRSKTQIFKFI